MIAEGTLNGDAFKVEMVHLPSENFKRPAMLSKLKWFIYQARKIKNIVILIIQMECCGFF